MRNKTRNMLAGVCIGLVGLGCLTGCEMTAEDMTKWEQKADEVIDKLENTNQATQEFNALLEQQLGKLSKQEAYDILKNANINMGLLNLRSTPYLYEKRELPIGNSDDDENFYKSICIPAENGYIEKSFYWDDSLNTYKNNYDIFKVDLNHLTMSYVCNVSAGEEQAALMSAEDYSEVKAHILQANLSNAGFGSLTLEKFDIDNILSYSLNEKGEYIFNLITSKVYDANESEEEDFTKRLSYYTIIVKDGVFVSIEEIGLTASGFEFELDVEGEKIPDGFGGYEIDMEPVCFYKTLTTFKYGSDIDSEELESINAIITKYDELARNNQIPEM